MPSSNSPYVGSVARSCTAGASVRSVVYGTKVEDVFAHGEDTGEGQEDHDDDMRIRAKEILEIPMCANCVVEVELDSLDQKTVVQKALRRVDKSDGGMSRNRWEKREGIVTRSAMGHIKRVPSKMSRVPEEAAALSHTRPRSSRMAGDGTVSGSGESGDDGGECIVPLDSVIYASMLDPLGLSAFKPSPTKPIPRWMQMLPNQRRPPAQTERRPRSILDEHFRDVSSASAKDSQASDLNTVCPTSPEPEARRPLTPTRSSPRRSRTEGSVSSHHSEYDELPQISITVPRGRTISFVTNEPLKRPSSRVLNQGSSEEQSDKSSRPSSPRLHSRSSSPLPEQVISHLQRIVRRTPPPQSKEYLNLYKPTQGTGQSSSNLSMAMPGRKRGRHVDPMEIPHVADLLRRNSRSSVSSPHLSDDQATASPNKGQRDESTGSRRKVVQAELKRLFRGGAAS
ncbi:uncharacterized protein BCR38DRAFT_480922 [Pseudomassariella vexata]|uniref:Uncharacterized protein n=1 Tax=Pseudomassariella vexata TaxID=1141098 RepID=A0A1Y2EEL0_9PEZI|nr:uncharacterized protein BCR38DRAFT_480922 [Pseudomassariella vexata]ORY69754.1 hypothetical protein BCR38DRAFT_480922 [Pseudomassariella vexata]